MTPKTISLVKDSWARLLPISDMAATLFYNRLFNTYPEVDPLFKGDMKSQGLKLMAMIDTAVKGLDDMEPMVANIEVMGARHADFGVSNADYDKMADALLWTLAQGLGPDFTPEVEEAWTQVYGILADTMKTGAAKH